MNSVQASVPDVVSGWLQAHPLTAAEVDCAVTVMLKILDGKCKMNSLEKVVMTWLYDGVKNRTMARIDHSVHQLVAEARAGDDEMLKDRIYEMRVLLETMISRPVMKAFKARIRQQGLFDTLGPLLVEQEAIIDAG